MEKYRPARRLGIVEKDAWLKPSEQALIDRYERYRSRLSQIESHSGSLIKFADRYTYLGINYDSGKKGWYYREWAPKAKGLYLIGDFNDWDRSAHPLQRNEEGIWEIFLKKSEYKDRFKHGSYIKVLVHGENGTWKERIPAYINKVHQDDETKDFCGELWFPHEKFNWQDDNFSVGQLSELLIYECHVGMASEQENIGSYLDFAEHILPRIKKAGYNTLQIMAVAEHPYYGSFGYHVSNFFAPSSRFGNPEELKYLVKKAHSMGLAVIMDIVHSHTVKNTNEGLNEFDGSEYQYFHPGSRGEHPAWDSKLFDYGKWEVIQFLLSNIKYWMREFHFDGFRFDGVTSMMYFHHGFTEFDSREKFFTDGVEFDAITYLQLANKLIHDLNKDAVSIAEDVSGMPGLCEEVNEGGLGFDYRLGMGIPDFWIKYLKDKKDEDWSIHEMWHVLNDRVPGVKTISYAESHDQALVGDKTIAFRLMDKEMYFHMMKNDPNPVIDRGIALHKMIRLFTIGLGGQAYLNFMGNEFGHPEWIDFPREGNNWSYKYARRQWSLVDNPELKYEYLAAFDREMLQIVNQYRVLSWEFARQLNVDELNKTIVFERSGLIFLFNFHVSNSIPDYEFYVPKMGAYEIILNSDSPEFGGFNRIDTNIEYITTGHGTANTLKIYNTNRTALVFKRIV